MNKKELVKAVSERFEGSTQKEIGAFLDIFEQVVTETVAKGEDVKTGLGTFKRKVKKGRSGVSRLHGQEKAWTTEDEFVPTFVSGKAFKESVK